MTQFAQGVTGARVIISDPNGVLLVSEPSEGAIVALPDADRSGVADSVVILIEGLNKPHGMALRCASGNMADCKLYVGETDKLTVFDYDATSMKATNKKKLVDLPSSKLAEHSTRTLLFLPEPNKDDLLISVGSTCNACNEKDEKRATILSYNLSTKKLEVYAKGLRNAVFMQIEPKTGALWATEMGRDGLGDEVPPDELNIIEKGKNYGWPICYGKNIHDDDFDKNAYIRNPCQDPIETPSFVDFPAHSAPLGLAFAPLSWPSEYADNVFVAFHGSWNRSTPTGYKVVRVTFDKEGKYLGTEDFITGWLTKDEKRIGRPADIMIGKSGDMYISDDQAGVIYRVVQKK